MANRDVPSTSYDLFSYLDQDDFLEEEEEEEVVQPPPKCPHTTHTYPCNVKLSKKLTSKKESVSKPHMYNS